MKGELGVTKGMAEARATTVMQVVKQGKKVKLYGGEKRTKTPRER